MSEATKPRRKQTSRIAQATQIEPDVLYRFTHFKLVSGLTDQRIQKASRDFNLKPKTYDLGSWRYIQGSDGIEFIKQLAAAMKAAKQTAK